MCFNSPKCYQPAYQLYFPQLRPIWNLREARRLPLKLFWITQMSHRIINGVKNGSASAGYSFPHYKGFHLLGDSMTVLIHFQQHSHFRFELLIQRRYPIISLNLLLWQRGNDYINVTMKGHGKKTLDCMWKNCMWGQIQCHHETNDTLIETLIGWPCTRKIPTSALVTRCHFLTLHVKVNGYLMFNQ